ncbi:LOW QUALITY PROTEIN: myosin-IIIb-like [Liolophura sinensis]|uniref:LOW QUALITY PROTEIN: myosin-IIIb-like n=1 Tax=Liolophura sinensis TaxID=3198878 RepID=UPI003158FF46
MTKTVNDLATLPCLDARAILEHLRSRHASNQYYTYIGDVVVAVNPFKRLNIYGKQYHYKYQKAKLRSDLKPHIFWLADHAYKRMRERRSPQCILVSGESGSGKTENSKLMVQHITFICQSSHPFLEAKINEVNPLLEAFGNAKTAMNDNSSRFGKYLELKFTPAGILTGAKITDYLLEKTRVTQQGAGERSFHIFYYLFAGMTREELSNYYLETPEDYRILRDEARGGPVFNSAADIESHRLMFHKQLNILKLVGFTEWEISMIFTLLGAVLHTTNITLPKHEESDLVYIVDELPLHIVCKLMGLNEAAVAESLSPVPHTPEGASHHEQKPPPSEGWVGMLSPRRCNARLLADCKKLDLSVGILDMSGFENFTNNSFEQLCINVANEQMQ